MKKKLFLIISVMLIAIISIGVFVACGATANDISKILATNGANYSEIAKFQLPENTSINNANSNKYALMLSRQSSSGSSEYALFNVSKNALVTSWMKYLKAIELSVSFPPSNDGGSSSQGNYKVGWISYDGERFTMVYDSEGRQFTSFLTLNSMSVYNNPSSYFDATGINKTQDEYILEKTSYTGNSKSIYHLANGVLVNNLDENADIINDIQQRNDKIIKQNDYYYLFKDNIIKVYDYLLSYRKTVDLNSLLQLVDTSQLEIHVLKSGKLIAQALTLLPNDVSNYDVHTNGYKFNVDTYIVDVVNSQAELIKFDYYISSFSNVKSQPEPLMSKFNCDSYASVSRIKDKNLVKNEYFVAFDANGTVIYNSYDDKDVRLQHASFVKQIAADKFLFETKDISGSLECYYVVDLNGNILQEVVAKDIKFIYDKGFLVDEVLFGFVNNEKIELPGINEFLFSSNFGFVNRVLREDKGYDLYFNNGTTNTLLVSNYISYKNVNSRLCEIEVSNNKHILIDMYKGEVLQESASGGVNVNNGVAGTYYYKFGDTYYVL